MQRFGYEKFLGSCCPISRKVSESHEGGGISLTWRRGGAGPARNDPFRLLTSLGGGGRENVCEDRMMGESVDATNAEHYGWGEVSDGWRLLDRPGLSVIEERVPAGAGEEWHVHDAATQFFYVLEG